MLSCGAQAGLAVPGQSGLGVGLLRPRQVPGATPLGKPLASRLSPWWGLKHSEGIPHFLSSPFAQKYILLVYYVLSLPPFSLWISPEIRVASGGASRGRVLPGHHPPPKLLVAPGVPGTVVSPCPSLPLSPCGASPVFVCMGTCPYEDTSRWIKAQPSDLILT